MAKAKSKGGYALGPSTADEERWRVEDALRTLERAGEIVHDAKLMAKVKECAAEKVVEMKAIAKLAGPLARMGRISPKQMAKLGSR